MSNIGDYASRYRNFQFDVPEYFNFAFDIVDKWAENSTQQAMLWVDDDGSERRLTYRHFRDRSNQVANAFYELGLKKGDRLLVILPRIPQWWEIMLGAIKSGMVAMPGTTQLTSKDIIYRLQAAQARVIVTDQENAAKFSDVRTQCPEVDRFIVIGEECEGWHNYEKLVEAMPTEIRPAAYCHSDKDDLMLLYFTSGTTGYPKMVLHTHSSYPIGHQVTGRYWLDLRPEDLHWNLSDTGWAKAAWSSLFGPLHTGSTLFIHNGKGKFSAPMTLALLAKYSITSFCAPPTAYRLMIVEDLSSYDLSRLRSSVSAGEPLNPEIIESWQRQTNLTIREGYGQTETCLLVANFPGMEIKPGSMGKSAPGFEVEIVDENGNIAPPHQEGDIAVRVHPRRPVGLFKEYWNDPQANQAASRGDWYITGDRGFRDMDDYLWFVGRADDVIISAGYRIGPFEVESCLLEHPAVVEAAVVGKPDAQRGQIVKAYVILKVGIVGTSELAVEIQEFVKHITAPYKYPREIEFVTELPKTISGKIRRVELRDRHGEGKPVDNKTNIDSPDGEAFLLETISLMTDAQLALAIMSAIANPYDLEAQRLKPLLEAEQQRRKQSE
ncbi:MAG: AMP-binding protein [Acidobacteriota bacterium]